MIRTHQEDQEIEDVISLIEYMSDFIRPPPWCVNDSEEFYRMSRVIFSRCYFIVSLTDV